MYPFTLLNDPPAPTYPEYARLYAEARATCPRFVDPANLYPARPVAQRRGDDWCTAVLGRPTDAYDYDRWTHVEHHFLILADAAGINPPLPGWIVEGRAESARRNAQRLADQQAQRDREAQRWADVLAAGPSGAGFEVREGSHNRVRGSRYEPTRHVVPSVDVRSGVRRIRIHPAGRALCETERRSRPLDISDSAVDAPANCRRCLDWIPNTRTDQGAQ